MAGDDEPLTDSGWLARLLKLREPPTPPRRPKTIYYEAPEDPLPELFYNEVMPATTTWPPVHKPWPLQAPSPSDRSPMLGMRPLPVAADSPLPSSRSSTRVVGMPITVERVSRHARTSRLSELEKLSKRIEKLEHPARAERSYRRVQPQAPDPAGQPAWERRYDQRVRRLDRGRCPHLLRGGVDDEQLLARPLDRRVLARHVFVSSMKGCPVPIQRRRAESDNDRTTRL